MALEQQKAELEQLIQDGKKKAEEIVKRSGDIITSGPGYIGFGRFQLESPAVLTTPGI